MPNHRQRLSYRQKKNFCLKKNNKFRQELAGKFFIALGLVFFIFPFVFKTFSNLQALSDFGPITIDQQFLYLRSSKQAIVRILIPSLSLDLPVVEASLKNGFWEMSEASASHGVGSANPGEPGNTVIFAHAREGLFLPLRKIQQGALIYLLTNNRWYTYKVTEIKDVGPKDVKVIAPTIDESLTLFTCSGFLDAKRLIVSAKPLLPARISL